MEEVGMKVLVPMKRVVDPYVTIHVKKDGSGVETQNVKMSMNPFDEIAMEEAIRWKEKNTVQEIVAVSIGETQAQETLRHALALGADEALHIATDKSLQPLQIAKILQWTAQTHKPDIIIMGKQAIDDDCNQTGQMLAALLGWPQATFASHIEFIDAETVRVVREVDGGLETIKVSLPCVITTDLRLNEPRYPALPNIMKAKKKPLKVMALEETALELESKVQVTKVEPPAPRKAGKMLKDVSELMHALHNIEKVI